MATFSYQAVNKDGKTESGTLAAIDTLSAGHLLKEQGLLPLDLREKRGIDWLEKLHSMSSVNLKQKIVFIEDLHVMIKSGIPAPRALKIIAKQTRNKRFQITLLDLANSVESGKSLNEAMEKYPKIFSHIFVSMVKVGELSGNLEKSLEYLSIQLEREADLKSKTKGAMIYPAVILSAMIIIGVLMAIFVLPKLTAIFKEFNTNLPLMTRIVIHISDFASSNAIIVLILMFGIIGGFIAFLRTEIGKRSVDWLILHFPIIAPIIKKINLARFSRIMSSLMNSGISVIEGLNVTAQAIENSYYRQSIKQAAEGVRLGKPLTEALSKNPKLFPYITTQMLEIGEETGSLENILEQIAVHFEAEVDNTMKNFSSIIEPLLLLFIGSVVGILALALIMPIYNISQNIN